MIAQNPEQLANDVLDRIEKKLKETKS